jgi:acyl-CoA reductase-like NAD-dependent aldehyde dehydrogenase
MVIDFSESLPSGPSPALMLAHVGSTATGRSISEACVRTGAKALLENGGSNPLIVDAGVDPAWAAAQAALGAGAFYPPTVPAGCTDEMAVLREETFGPVAPVAVVESFDEALRRAADSPYGLAATVLTGSMSHAQRAWRALPVGTVKINAVFGGAPGGAAHPRRGSGQGFGYGPELLDELTATKAVHLEAPPAGW